MVSLTKRDEYFINVAATAALQSDITHYKIGACFHKKKRASVCGFAHQRNKLDNFFLSSIHAEVHALKRYFDSLVDKRDRTKRYECVYVVRTSGSNSDRFMNAKPCSICVLMMQSFNIKYCCYSTGNVKNPFIKERIRDLELDHLSSAQKHYMTSQVTRYSYTNWF